MKRQQAVVAKEHIYNCGKRNKDWPTFPPKLLKQTKGVVEKEEGKEEDVFKGTFKIIKQKVQVVGVFN